MQLGCEEVEGTSWMKGVRNFTKVWGFAQLYLFFQLMLSFGTVFLTNTLVHPSWIPALRTRKFHLRGGEGSRRGCRSNSLFAEGLWPSHCPTAESPQGREDKTSGIYHPVCQWPKIHFYWCQTCSVGIVSPYGGFHHNGDAETALT